jgi:large subunit ribosomal protein L29
MKAQQFREMSPVELKDRLEELEKQLFDLHSQAVTEKLENSKAIINLKRDIARLKTVIREHQLQGK